MFAGPIEEPSKLAAAYWVGRKLKSRSIIVGMLIGASAGAGFALFESAGYAFKPFLIPTASNDDKVSAAFDITLLRALLTPLGHVTWTALTTGALWKSLQYRGTLAEYRSRFWPVFIFAIVMHMAWNSPLHESLGFLMTIPIGFLVVYIWLSLLSEGFRDIKVLGRH
jgi:RsiW-degrading membrane proteinase PrsW (M82 family)